MTAGRSLPSRALLVGVLAVAGVAPGRAQDGASVADEPPSRPAGVPTRLGQEVVAASDMIAVVQAETVDTAAFGVVLVQARTLDVLGGAALGEARVGTTIAIVGYPGAVEDRERALLFLRAMPSGDRFAIVHRVRQREDHFADKLDIARRTVALAGLENAQERARATVDWLLASVGSHDPWRVRYGLGELSWMAAAQPWALPRGTAERLRALAPRAADRRLADDVKNVARTVEDLEQRLPDPADKAPSSP